MLYLVDETAMDKHPDKHPTPLFLPGTQVELFVSARGWCAGNIIDADYDIVVGFRYCVQLYTDEVQQ